VIVDFSSPNIAKEMHVGHLRSTIIGDSICRVLEWMGHEVLRRNHVGDWGTQFGMLITHLKDQFPNFLSERPPIADLQEFYKASKKRFDAEEDFKKRAYEAVVNLQQGAARAHAGEEECMEVKGWKILCDISRAEFDKIYSRLQVKDLEEKGESFYNPMLNQTVKDLIACGVARPEKTEKGTCTIADNLLITPPHLHDNAKKTVVQDLEEGVGAKKVKADLAEYKGLGNLKVSPEKDQNSKATGSYIATVEWATRADAEAAMAKAAAEGIKMVWCNPPPPLMVQKSDGGFGYDSTDMAAIRYRVDEEKADWIIYVTDVGQSLHFQLIFDAARKAGWLNPEQVRVDHIGFGLVLAPEGGKFKTRSGDTVRLVDLLDEAKDRALAVIAENNKDDFLTPDEVANAGPIMGYGAVKYADLANVLDKDYTFDFDKMLNFKGNTAVYLLYAYARVQSIFRKCAMEGADREAFSKKNVKPAMEQPEEVEIAMHLVRFGETVDNILLDLHPHHITDFAYKLAELMQKFCGSKNCKVLGSDPDVQSARLALLHLANSTLGLCMNLVGIDTLDKL
jgi:arginyl-tRNA synthetase